MKYISFKYENALEFFNQNELDYHDEIVQKAHKTLHKKTGHGSELSGWIHLPEDYDKDEFLQIKETAQKISQNSDILLVIGIGGSYLGARAAIEMLTHSFQNLLTKEKRLVPQIIFVGHHMSATYINELFDIIEQKDVSINIISKSGTTTEPAIAFRIFKKFIEDKYGKEEAKNRIYVTTDKAKGALKTIAQKEGYKCFVIPDDIGGRFSVLTAVGLLPIAVSGICIDDIMDGARIAMNELSTPSLKHNQANQYAAIRNILYNKGKSIEILANYEPQLSYFSEWWKQLFAESEGKDLKGIFPASANFTTDLHSIGQYIQDGQRNIFQTTLHIHKPIQNLMLEIDLNNYDGLNYLANKNLHDINHRAHQGALIAHNDGLVPNLIIELPILDARTFGYLVYFFIKSCAISGYLLGVNPFNQPGVDAYKENMFALLGKQGYEDKQQILEERLQNKELNKNI